MFGGANFGDEPILNRGLHPTATGGIQHIGFGDPSGDPLEIGPAVVRSETETVLEAQRLAYRGAVVRGVSEGVARLRVENADGLLYDAIDLSVMDIAYIDVVAVDLNGATHGANDTFAVFAGAKVARSFAPARSRACRRVALRSARRVRSHRRARVSRHRCAVQRMHPGDRNQARVFG